MNSEFKTYVLLEHMNPSAGNIYQRVNKNQRVPIDKMRVYSPYLRSTFTNKEGKNVTLRFKASTDELLQAEQIKNGIPANESFTRNERKALRFKNGALTTSNPTAQKYLESIPSFKGFEGYSDEVSRPEYEILDKQAELNDYDAATRNQIKAANKVIDMELAETESLLYRVFGTSHKPSDNPKEELRVKENRRVLIEAMNENDKVVAEVLKDTLNEDEEVLVLMGKALTAGVISFDDVANQVALKRNNEWVPVKMISNEYDAEERKRQFAQFLTSEAGKALRNDIEAGLDGGKKSTKPKKQ